jgi:Holliday junction resolvase RusA-like endonuclease
VRSVVFTVPGTPVGKGRPRFGRRGNFVATYTPEKTAAYENLVRLHASIAMNGSKTLQDALCCVISVEVVPTPSWTKKKRQAALCGEISPIGKPDADNVAKAILDAMTGIVYDDDRQVCDLRVIKRYGQTAQAVVKIETMGSV